MAGKERPKAIGGENFLEGKLLIALPGMSDPRFERSVIFMCAHSVTGAMGLILNKPIEGLGFHELIRRLDLPVTPRTPDSPILFGGPVETGRGFVDAVRELRIRGLRRDDLLHAGSARLRRWMRGLSARCPVATG